MKFDFDYAVKLAKSDPAAFERYRTDVLNAHIASLPPARRVKMYIFQNKLNLRRADTTNQEFMKFIVDEMQDSLLNLDDQISRLTHIINGPPTNK